MADWLFRPITKKHNRADFDCGEPPLNDFLRYRARQLHRRKVSRTICAIHPFDETTVGGYFTLRPEHFRPEPESALFREIGHTVTGTLLARLAVDRRFAGQGLGQSLLMLALSEAMEGMKHIGGQGVILDAKEGPLASMSAIDSNSSARNSGSCGFRRALSNEFWTISLNCCNRCRPRHGRQVIKQLKSGGRI